ncbi:MAG TPA: molybdenum cofactor biosynthesis protein MoaE [Gemmatimonadaceae bacterium]|jgi:molybdopterin synthase catalytic subunit|nr:molybdenum cofactor biosynthesis protein MoaE [Gemmatimonadaceae bacterium]
MIATRLVRRPIDVGALAAAVASPAHGATALFVGTVRDVNDGRAVSGLDYSAYEAMAERELAAIGAEAAERFGVSALEVEHRLGTLALGEASVGIAAAHAHRAPALDAVRYVIEELKRRVPVWKREHYVDGSREWVDPSTADEAVPVRAEEEA